MKCLRSVGKNRPKRLGSELRVVLEHLLLRPSLGQQTEQEIDC
jgi:hypothetical protein